MGEEKPNKNSGIKAWQKYLNRNLTPMEIHYATGGLFSGGQIMPENFLKSKGGNKNGK